MPWLGRGAALTCVIVLAGAPLAGCGSKTASTVRQPTSSASADAGSAGAGTSTGEALSRSSLIAHADAICRETNAKLARTQAKGEGPEQVAAAVVENETIERKANGALAKLTPPAELASSWKKMLGYRRSLADQLGSLAAASRNHATASIKALGASKKKLHGDLRQLATKAGFKDCAKVGSR
jgi:hypothetical protein